MEHDAFAFNTVRTIVEEIGTNSVQAFAQGDLTDRPLTGSSTWLGIVVGTPVAGGAQGDRLVGTAALNYDMAVGGLDAAFSGIKNIDRGTVHPIEALIFSDIAIGPDGTFSEPANPAPVSRAASTAPDTPKLRAFSSGLTSSAPSGRLGNRHTNETGTGAWQSMHALARRVSEQVLGLRLQRDT